MKVVDDTKVDGKAFTKAECDITPKTLIELLTGLKKWQMSFN